MGRSVAWDMYRTEMRRLKRAEADASTEREASLDQIRAACARSRRRLQASCADRRQKARATARAKKAAAKEARRQKTADYRELRRAERRRAKQEAPRSTAAERRRESDDLVRSNIDPLLVPVFDKVKRSIKGSTRKSRTEEFLQYVEENASDIAWMLEQALPSDAEYAAEYAAWAEEG